MLFTGIANPRQLAVLTSALDDYCLSNNIAPQSEERDEAARLVLSLFDQGWRTPGELKARLAGMRKLLHLGITHRLPPAAHE